MLLIILLIIIIALCSIESFEPEKHVTRSNLIYNANVFPIPYTGSFSTHFIDNPAEQLEDMLIQKPEPDIRYQGNITAPLSKYYTCGYLNWNNKVTRPCYKNNKWMCCDEHNNFDKTWNLKENIEIHPNNKPCRNIYGFTIKGWNELNDAPGVCYIKKSEFPTDTNYNTGQRCCRFTDASGKYCLVDFNKEHSVQSVGNLFDWGDTCKHDII